jgi:hypothetical protein
MDGWMDGWMMMMRAFVLLVYYLFCLFITVHYCMRKSMALIKTATTPDIHHLSNSIVT